MNRTDPCLVCDAPLRSISTDRTRGIYGLDCYRCGRFRVTEEASQDWGAQHGRHLTPRGRAVISGWIRANPDTLISTETGRQLTSLSGPSVRERADVLLAEIEKRQEDMSVPVVVGADRDSQLDFMGLTSSVSYPEVVTLLIDYLGGQGMVRTTVIGENGRGAFITPTGYAHLDQRRASGGDRDIGFCAMWFDPSMIEVWTRAIEPAITDAGYLAQRIDRVAHNNKIDDEIVAALRRSKFVVADFTGQRGGVYFEAGFALALGRQVIWTVDEGDLAQVHFDTRQYNFIIWQRTAPDSLKTMLQNRIEATLGAGPHKK